MSRIDLYMTIKEVNPLQEDGWDTCVETYPNASFFHGKAWMRVLHDTYGFTPRYLVDTDAANKRALLPLVEVNSWITGKRGVSLPFTDECVPLGGNLAELFEAAVSLGRQQGWKRIELRCGDANPPEANLAGPGSFDSMIDQPCGNVEVLKHLECGRVGDRSSNDVHQSNTSLSSLISGAKPSVSFFNHRLLLEPNTAKLFAKFDSSTRRAVRKAEQSDLKIEFSRGLDAVHMFYELLRKTRQRHGAPPQPFRFFVNLQKHVLLPGHGWVVIAQSAGVPVAGAIFVHNTRHAIYKYGASDERYQQLRANNLVMWRAIDWYSQNDYTSFDFGRTSLGNEGLRRFKLGWGSSEQNLHYFRYNLRTNRFETTPDSSSGWQTPIFRRLPASLSQLIGTMLYKHTA